jgi:hypothetical protein
MQNVDYGWMNSLSGLYQVEYLGGVFVGKTDLQGQARRNTDGHGLALWELSITISRLRQGFGAQARTADHDHDVVRAGSTGDPGCGEVGSQAGMPASC